MFCRKLLLPTFRVRQSKGFFIACMSIYKTTWHCTHKVQRRRLILIGNLVVGSLHMWEQLGITSYSNIVLNNDGPFYVLTFTECFHFIRKRK